MNESSIHAPLVLFVDDEAVSVKYFERALNGIVAVATAQSVEEGISLLKKHADTLAVLVSDQQMPGGYGNELLLYAKEHYPQIVRILTTAYSEIDYTVEAVNQGQIHRYIKKPWELSTLRLEMKQAIEWALLRKEHAHLLREKLAIRHEQILASRIGALLALCLGLSSVEESCATECYLRLAYAAGVDAPMADWLTDDYSDLVSNEGMRNGRFSRLVRHAFQDLCKTVPDSGEVNKLAVIANCVGDSIVVQNDNTLKVCNKSILQEFLETPTKHSVSEHHAQWLASLLWLEKHGQVLEPVASSEPMSLRVTPAGVGSGVRRIADWIEQF